VNVFSEVENNLQIYFPLALKLYFKIFNLYEILRCIKAQFHFTVTDNSIMEIKE
jgi:hypothetical protein